MRKRIRCRLGIHSPDPKTIRIEEYKNYFGGPSWMFFWICKFCGHRGIT